MSTAPGWEQEAVSNPHIGGDGACVKNDKCIVVLERCHDITPRVAAAISDLPHKYVIEILVKQLYCELKDD